MRSIFGGVTEYNPDINNLARKRSASTDSESDKPVCKSDKVYYYQLLMKKTLHDVGVKLLSWAFILRRCPAVAVGRYHWSA